MPKRSRSKSMVSKTQKRQKKKTSRALAKDVYHALPPKMSVKLDYAGTVYLYSAAVDTYEYVFRGNSIFDPDFTGVGHQPYAHDQWATLYQRYRVKSSNIKMQFASASGITSPIHCCIVATNDSASMASFSLAAEMPGAVTGIISSPTGNGVCELSLSTTAKGMKGSAALTKDKEMEATFGSSPAIAWYYHVLVYQPGTASVGVRSFAKITYTTDIYDPVEMAQS